MVVEQRACSGESDVQFNRRHITVSNTSIGRRPLRPRAVVRCVLSAQRSALAILSGDLIYMVRTFRCHTNRQRRKGNFDSATTHMHKDKMMYTLFRFPVLRQHHLVRCTHPHLHLISPPAHQHQHHRWAHIYCQFEFFSEGLKGVFRRHIHSTSQNLSTSTGKSHAWSSTCL